MTDQPIDFDELEHAQPEDPGLGDQEQEAEPVDDDTFDPADVADDYETED